MHLLSFRIILIKIHKVCPKTSKKCSLILIRLAAIRNTICKINIVMEATLKRLNLGLLSRPSAWRRTTVPGKTKQGHTTDWHYLGVAALLPYGLFQRKKSICTFQLRFCCFQWAYMPNSIKKTKIKLEERQPFWIGRQNMPYVSPFNTARQFCSNCRLP